MLYEYKIECLLLKKMPQIFKKSMNIIISQSLNDMYVYKIFSLSEI